MTAKSSEKDGFAIVKSYMAHHQGMSLCAINNALNNNVLARRFMSVPEVRANEQLLFENMPVDPIRIKPMKVKFSGSRTRLVMRMNLFALSKKTLRKRSETKPPRLRGAFIRRKIKTRAIGKTQ